ncbi:MAG: ThuA domain-containing protein [Bacteroidales bacterium]|nr:ThuA domain-containing protein [Bacteroidales bacterium]
MKRFANIILIALVGVSLLSFPSCQENSESSAPYRALIITGQNNHSCDASTPILKQILDNSGLFDTDIAKSPAKGEDMSSFTPTFSNYDVVVLDYNGDSWTKETNQSFLDYVSGGGGVVVYHAADNAFPDWLEYNKIIGLGGWGDRNESDGPYVRWKDGKIVKDLSPGRAGSHGQQHAFLVTIRQEDHPITKGLPKEWLHAQDELYSQLRGPAENLTVLATAYADTATGGTGENEPVLMTIKYGKGRIFHTTLGHVMGTGPYPAVECVGFIVTLQRGAEWAASGEVTQEVPVAFPEYNTLSSWDKYRPYTLEEILACIESYKPGDSRICLQDLSNFIRANYADGDEWHETEEDLIKFLKGSATSDAKNYVCKEVSMFGSDDFVPVLNKLMKEEDTKEMARYALERIKGEYTN